MIFGCGEISKVGKEVACLGHRIGIVSYARHEPIANILSRATELVREQGCEVSTFYDVEENPGIETVQAGRSQFVQDGVDAVVGVGGGSAMDAAKAIAAAVFYDGDPWNMVNSRHDLPAATPPEKALPILLVPTVPATGSEMNKCAVLSNGRTREKSYIWADCLFPRTSILDPELTLELPASQTACAAVDAFSHVLEIYLNGEEHSPLQHHLQEAVMRTIVEHVATAMREPRNLEARATLMWTATCAINGFASPADAWTPMHQVGHALTALRGIPHGISLSVIMPAWMRLMSRKRPEPYRRFAQEVMRVDPGRKPGDQIGREGIEAFRAFMQGLGLPTSLAEVGVQRQDLRTIVDSVVRVSFGPDGVLKCVPPVSMNDLMAILEAALGE